ncbi:MAG: toxin-antitoxin system YwqK family antitoxin [Bacteroidia bacterium]
MKMTMLLTLIGLAVLSCKNEAGMQKKENAETAVVKTDSALTTTFTIAGSQDTVEVNGDHIERYKNGGIRIQGKMKDGKREGLWKSWYEDGKPWSETTFKAGIRNGKTKTWYENGNPRYEGEYTNDNESGKWTYWDESGKEVTKKDYDKKQP